MDILDLFPGKVCWQTIESYYMSHILWTIMMNPIVRTGILV